MSVAGSRLLFVGLLAAFTLVAVAGEPIKKVRLEMWKGCLCAGPKCARSFDQLARERDKRMLFGIDVEVTSNIREFYLREFMEPRLEDKELKQRWDIFRYAILYRQSGRGHYSLYSRHAGRFKMGDLKDGDLSVFYPEQF